MDVNVVGKFQHEANLYCNLGASPCGDEFFFWVPGTGCPSDEITSPAGLTFCKHMKRSHGPSVPSCVIHSNVYF